MRLIDADALMVKNHENVAVAHNERAAQLLENIMNAPPIEARPVVRGEWIEYDCFCCNSDGEPVVKTGSIFACSICGREERYREPFCHCGADMRGDDDETD